MSDTKHNAIDSTSEPAPSPREGITRRDALRVLAGGVAAGVVMLGNPLRALADTQSDLDAAQSQLDAAQAQLDQISSEYVEIAKQQSDTMDKLEAKQKEIDDTQSQIDAKQSELDQKKDQLSQHISSYYKSGQSSMLDMVLSSTSFDDLITNVYYAGKINSSEESMIQDVKDTKDALDAQKSQLESEKADLEQIKADLDDQASQMQAKQAETQTLLDGLSQQVKDLMNQRDEELAAAAAEAAAAAKKSSGGASGSANYTTGTTPSFTGGTGSQQAVVSACYSTPSPGLGYCAAWVTNVFVNAGIGSFSGNACDMYNWYCTSSDKSAIQPGMIVAVSTHSHTSAGSIYGHIGIYVGGGNMMDNVGYIRTISLDEWVNYYSTTVTPRWGWLGGVALA
ncbi:MAG: hypothetical protein LKI25_01560 [Atopobiaceae bacterium]|nr:hypothetical protein [Atopobiaceae bacterium]MCI2172895.1 hypothetical protein [Atopobiaceae bacterium]MCI2208300.1 hypothetical protein [Atopobiaceae bacterium]